MNDLSFKRELAEASKDLLEDKSFQHACLQLRKRWFEQALTVKEPAIKLEYLAMLKALESIPQELTVLVNDYRMAKRNG